MFFRLLYESFRRQRRRKAMAGLAILLGTTAITAMLALATTIGDRIHAELAVYGANIVVTPKAANLDVNIGGQDIHPVTGNAYLRESDLAKLRTIFWANNITGVSPELRIPMSIASVAAKSEGESGSGFVQTTALGVWFGHNLGGLLTGAPQLHPNWSISGAWPATEGETVVGSALASRLNLHVGQNLLAQASSSASPASSTARTLVITGILSTGAAADTELLIPLAGAQHFAGLPDAVSRVEVSARTKPEDAFARQNPDKLSPSQYEIWYCRPYANSIARQIQEAIPGSDAQQVRQVEQTEGTVLSRISGLMWLISAAALLAAAFAVSAAMATAILERRAEIGLMRSLGAPRASIALLFYVETGLLAVFSGTLGYLLGSALAAWLGARIFPNAPGVSASLAHTLGSAFNPVLLPVTVGIALLIAIAGSTPSIRAALRLDPSAILRADA